MKIDDKKYVLDKNHFFNKKNKKKKIVLTNSFSKDMKFFKGWELRRNKNYKKVTPYTVDVDGTVYQHYNPEYYSNFLKLEELDKQTIPITVVNQGWLKKDSLTNKYKDWVGNIYSGDDVYNKEWRGHYMWAPYSKQQMESVANLVDYLCDKYKIERNSLSHNVMFEHSLSFKGVLSRSNFSRRFTDISPSFRFEYIDNKLLKEQTNE